MKKLICLGLSFLMFLQTPLITLAGEAGSSASQGDFSISPSKGTGGNGTWNLNTKTGFRFTICDAKGVPVSNIYGKYDSLDVINSGVVWGDGEFWTACATQQLPGDNSAGAVFPIRMANFLEMIGEPGYPLRWSSEPYNVHGEEVKAFILKGAEEATGGGGSGSVGSVGSVTEETTTSGNKRIEITIGNETIVCYSDEEAQAVNDFSLYFDKAINEWGMEIKGLTDPNGKTNLEKAKQISNVIVSQRATLKSKLDSKVTAQNYGADYLRIKLNLISNWNIYIGRLEHKLLNVYGSALGNNVAGEYFQFTWEEFPDVYAYNQAITHTASVDTGFKLADLNPFNIGLLTAYASSRDTSFDRLKDDTTAKDNEGPGKEDDIENSAIKSNEEKENEKKEEEEKQITINENAVLAKIINMKDDNGVYIFNLEGVTDTKTPVHVFIENGYILLVENTIQGCPQGWNTKKNCAGSSYKHQVYGTAHNWLVGFGNSASFTSSAAYSPSFGNHQKALTRALPNGLVTVSDWVYLGGETILAKPSHGDQWKIADATAHMKEGYGCHLYTAIDLGAPEGTKIITDDPLDNYNIIHTYNINTNPDYDDYSEPSDEKKDPEKYGDKALHFSIDKHYRYRDSITNEVTEISYYTTVNAPHTVIIQDEREQTGFALKDWFTSTDDWLPPDGGTPSDYNWESVVKGQHKNGKYEGTGEKTLTVKPEDPDNVLHLLYEFEGKPFINIVKIYKNEDGSVNHTKGPEPHEDTKKYKVEEDEEGFSYVETLISTQDPDPGNPNGTPTKSRDIDIPKGTKTLYIIYQAKGKQIILYSNELTYSYDLRDLVKERVLFGIYDQAPKSPATSPECELHSCGGSGENCPHYHTCSLHSQWLPDPNFSMTVADNFDYNNGTTFILDYAQTNEGGASFSKSWTTGVSGKTPGITDRVKPNYDYILYRQKDKDLVTLYPKKNDGLSGELSRLGINTTAYTPAGSRAEKEMTKDKYFENHFQTHLDYTAHDTSLTWNWSRAECNTNRTGTYTTIEVAKPQGANDFYSKNPSNVKEYYFVGQANEGLDTNISDTRPGDDAFVSKYRRNQAYATVSAELSFYPYAKMFYRGKNDNNNLQDVFVTSENLSKMSVFNAMQVGIYKKNEINANLTSTQWSTHARSMEFLGNANVDDKKSVLPGGAIQDIDMGNQGDTQLGLRLWQTCLPDGQVEAVQEGFKVSETEARSATDALIESIKTAIGGYGLVQWGAEGVHPEFRSILSGSELHENTSVPFVLGNSNTTAADAKYYLRHDGTGSSRANFDCLDARIERQNLYTIYSDTDGNVWVTKDGAELGRISLTESADTLINKSKELQLLDANTKLITNYVAALDRNKGDKSKYDRYDKNKYNEAFDGVSVLLTDISFDIGFGQGMTKRTNVLDPLLVAQAESKSDLYNFADESKVRSSVYVTTTTSTASDKQQDGYFGTLKAVSGIGDLEIGISDIQSMVYTKNFYIPNATVSDLN